MKKIVEFKNDSRDRACDLIREDDVLCYHMKYRDKQGHARDVVIAAIDMICKTWEYMTEGERNTIITRIQAYKN